jgi:hypothetical protein
MSEHENSVSQFGERNEERAAFPQRKRHAFSPGEKQGFCRCTPRNQPKEQKPPQPKGRPFFQPETRASVRQNFG